MNPVRKILSEILISTFFFSCTPQVGMQNNLVQQGSEISPQELGEFTLSHWPTELLPIPLHISEQFSEEEANTIEQMCDQWEQEKIERPPFFQMHFNAPSLNHYKNIFEFRDSVVGIYKSSEWFPQVHPRALAITQYFGEKKFIGGNPPQFYIEFHHADIILNTQSYKFSHAPHEAPENAVDTYDLGSVIIHEVGHLLGLPHRNQRSDSVMKPTLDTHTIARQLRPMDRQQIQNNYFSQSKIKQKLAVLTEEKNNSPQLQDTFIYGRIELHPDGNCRHYLDRQLVHTHRRQQHN